MAKNFLIKTKKEQGRKGFNNNFNFSNEVSKNFNFFIPKRFIFNNLKGWIKSNTFFLNLKDMKGVGYAVYLSLIYFILMKGGYKRACNI